MSERFAGCEVPNASGRLGVVHLVWGPLGTTPLKAFLDAYRALPAGAAHELIVVLNGVGARQAPAADASRASLLKELEVVEHRLIELERPVLDLAAYRLAATRLEHDRLCFLNSYSQPLTHGWLELLSKAADEPGVGMVGATGSWASHSSHMRYLVGLGGPYARLYGDRATVRSVFAPSPAVMAQADEDRTRAPVLELASRFAAARLLLTRFPAFPDPHLRSNAFLIDRELMLRLDCGRLADKTDTYLLESGRRSLTRQVERAGRRVVVVGRDGVSYGPRDWARSRTFWQGSQENLIIADNQTRGYRQAGLDVRRTLSYHAWGEQAAPDAPGSGLGEGALTTDGWHADQRG